MTFSFSEVGRFCNSTRFIEVCVITVFFKTILNPLLRSSYSAVCLLSSRTLWRRLCWYTSGVSWSKLTTVSTPVRASLRGSSSGRITYNFALCIFLPVLLSKDRSFYAEPNTLQCCRMPLCESLPRMSPLQAFIISVCGRRCCI